jgi:hypothetical protein
VRITRWPVLPYLAIAAGLTVAFAYANRDVQSISASAQTQAIALGSTVPADFSPTQSAAVTFAWQSFVALNWPALAQARGAPDPSKTIGQPGAVVWNTWKAPEEIFLAQAQAPPPWSQFGGSLPAECTSAGATAGDFALARISKSPRNSSSPVLSDIQQVVGGTLTDQHGNLARYDVRVNQTLFDAIVANQYYNRAVQDRATMISFPSGVMEVKAAWRQMTADDTPAIKARIFRRDAWIYTPGAPPQPATCVKGEVGLVGLHISQKTPTRPQWAWATFEQVDNVPAFGTTQPPPGRTLPYSFFNPACPPDTCVPNQSTEKNGQPTSTPTQVTRRVNIGAVAQTSNPLWQAALTKAVPSSPFAFYQLVDIQWQASPNAPPAPFLNANTTLETYVSQSSCINCHSRAKIASGKISSDYSYVLAEAQSPAGPAAR